MRERNFYIKFGTPKHQGRPCPKKSERSKVPFGRPPMRERKSIRLRRTYGWLSARLNPRIEAAGKTIQKVHLRLGSHSDARAVPTVLDVGLRQLAPIPSGIPKPDRC
jgi:hypothetical protein